MNKNVRRLLLPGLIVIGLAIICSTGWGATATGPAGQPRSAAKGKSMKILNANAWTINTTNYGPFVYPASSSAGGSWGGPTYNYIYGAGMWVGALDTLDSVHVSLGYYPNNGGSEFGPINPITGDWINQATDPLARFYLSTDPLDLAQWPLRDSLGQPIVVSTQDGYAAYNDLNPAFTFTGETPVGVRIDQVSYAWSFAQFNDMVFFRYKVKNLTADTLKNMYIGPCFDADIGDESIGNDRTDFDYTRNLAIQFQTEAEPGWPRVGYFGCRFFESPRNNTGQTINVVDNQFPHSVLPDSLLGMTSFKIFPIAEDPQTDPDRYKLLRGINHVSNIEDAYDEMGATFPDDKRFVMASGPFHLAPGDSAATCVAVMAGYDTATLKALSDNAQVIYDNGFATIPITITSPNGGEVVSGTASITWSAAAPACSLSLYYSADEGMSWTLIADSIPNTGSYSWNTLGVPDGVRYMISAFIYNQTSFGADRSDNLFTVNNAAIDAHPEIALVSPVGGESWSGGQYLKYFYGHADNDICRIEFRLKGPNGTWDSLTTVDRFSQSWTRDSLPWNTATVPNYPYYTLRMKARDSNPADTVVIGSDSFAISNNFPEIDSLQHTAGSSNAVIVNPYVWDEGQLTGHRYEFRFRNITRGAQVGDYQPRYSYDLWDTDLNTAVLTNRGLSTTMNDSWQWDVPGPVDGFIPEVRYRQNIATITTDSARVTTEAGAVSADTLFSIAGSSNTQWMARGTAYQVRWHVRGVYPSDTLTAEVWDMDNNVLVPLDTLGYNNLTQSAWSFGATATGRGRTCLAGTMSTVVRYYMFICGSVLYYNRGTSLHVITWATHPEEGEVWTLYTSGYKPPRQGDIFSFLGANGVSGSPLAPAGALSLFQNAPNPFNQGTTLQFQLAGPAAVSLKIYNIAGQLVRTLVDGRQGAGMHAVRWDGRNDTGQKLSAGIYLYRLQAGDKTLTRKLVLVR